MEIKIPEIEARTVLLTYEGSNNQLLDWKRKIDEVKNFKLTRPQAEYVMKYYDYKERFEDIDDIVIAQEKLNSISRILLSDRYEFKKSHDTIIYWAKGLSGNDDVDRHVLESLLDKLNQMIKLVSKL